MVNKEILRKIIINTIDDKTKQFNEILSELNQLDNIDLSLKSVDLIQILSELNQYKIILSYEDITRKNFESINTIWKLITREYPDDIFIPGNVIEGKGK